MTVDAIPHELRIADKFHHIDMGFVNRRLCIGFLTPDLQCEHLASFTLDSGPTASLASDHLLVTMVLDGCRAWNAPTLLGAVNKNAETHLFRSTERLEPCPEVYESPRVRHQVRLDIELDKPIFVAYHTEHIVSSTGKMVLACGAPDNYVVSIVGRLHDKNNCYEIEPMVMGTPWYDHPRNGTELERNALMLWGRQFGEILPEDIDEFKRMSEITVKSADEWMNVMKAIPESEVKNAFGKLLGEPTKSDWGGEFDDHFSGSVTINQRRRTAAFLLKGPSKFREMTLDMCGRRADQIHRMVDSRADVSIVQHAHLVGSVVRNTLRNQTICPGDRHRKYCVIDGKSTYRILKAYSLI